MNVISLPVRSPGSPRVIAWKVILLGIPLVVATAFFFVLRGQSSRLANRTLGSFGTVPSFQLVNQEGQPFGSAQLAGRIWIADFVYTSCPGPCPMISSRMSELQKPLEKSDVHLVSVSVDPERDTPGILRTYAEKLHAQRDRWDFLTGSKDTIYDLSRNGFKLAIEDGSRDAGLPVHSTRFVLVDRSGTIRGYYDATEADAITKIVADTKHLLREQPR